MLSHRFALWTRFQLCGFDVVLKLSFCLLAGRGGVPGLETVCTEFVVASANRLLLAFDSSIHGDSIGAVREWTELLIGV